MPRNTDLALMAFSIVPLAGVFWIDPELGMVRDWDLLAIFGIPLSLWAGWRLLYVTGAKKLVDALAFAALLAAAVHIVPDVYEKNHPDLALERMNDRLWDSPHYQTSYYRAVRSMSWGTLMSKAESRNKYAARFFKRMLEAQPGSAEVWYNLGITYRDRGMLDSALYAFRTAYNSNSLRPQLLRQLSMAENRLNLLDSAEVHIARAIEVDSRNPDNFAIQGTILYKQGRVEDALDSFRQSHRLKPNGFNQLANLGRIFFQVRQLDSAAFYLYRAVMADPSQADIYENLIISLIATDRRSDAQRVLSAYRRIYPGAGNLEEYEKTALELITTED
jgi:tetratricopeptide (TPR) repeat protein